MFNEHAKELAVDGSAPQEGSRGLRGGPQQRARAARPAHQRHQQRGLAEQVCAQDGQPDLHAACEPKPNWPACKPGERGACSAIAGTWLCGTHWSYVQRSRSASWPAPRAGEPHAPPHIRTCRTGFACRTHHCPHAKTKATLRYNQQVCGPPYRDVPGGLTGPGTRAP